MSIQYCSEEDLEFGRRSRLEGFPDKQAMTVTRYVLDSIQIVLLILGLVINSLICFVMLRRGKVKKNLSNFFLFNLSLTELVLWMVLLPLMATINMAQIKTEIPCKVLVFSICTCLAVIFGLLAAIAFDRYTNIVTPLKGITMEERKFTALAVIWAAAVVLSAPFLYSVEMRVLSMKFQTHPAITGLNSTSNSKPAAVTIKWTYINRPSVVRQIHIKHQTVTNVSNTTTTGTGRNETGFNSTKMRNATCILPLRVCDIPAELKGQISFTIFFILSFVFPLIIILVAYGKVVQRLWLRSRTLDAKGTAAKAKVRGVRMLIVVVLTYLITDGPWIVAYLLYCFEPRDRLPLQSHFAAVAIVTTLFFASAVLTPTIHAIHSSTVQREIVAVLCCRFRESDSFAPSTAPRISTNKKYRTIRFAKSEDTLKQDATASDGLVSRAEAE